MSDNPSSLQGITSRVQVNRQAANNLPNNTEFHLPTASIYWLYNQYTSDEKS